MRPHLWAWLSGVAALLGLIFAAFSTHDFMAHLDRQVHGIHCSFLPGVVGPDASGSSGCHVTLMSPYSSVFRDDIWGGIPVSLPAMSVFAFLLFWTVNLVLTRRQTDPRATGFLLLGWALPLMASVAMAIVSFAELEAACKLCIGIYVASGLGFGFAGAWFLRAMGVWHEGGTGGDPRGAPPSASWGRLAAAFGLGVVFVAVPLVAYAASAPDFERYLSSCGKLRHPEDPENVLVPVGSREPEVRAVEVLDPLCPACRGFEQRFRASGFGDDVRRELLLFPLDSQCNWMVDTAIHPGACTVSEAILCAEDRPEEVVDWAFENQAQIRKTAEEDPKAAARMIGERFPGLEGCVGSAQVRARLNRALRWAVKNQLPVLTPQLYVDGVKLCDQDTDLGMAYMMRRLIRRAQEDT